MNWAEIIYACLWVSVLVATGALTSAVDTAAWLVRRVQASDSQYASEGKALIGSRCSFSGHLLDVPNTAVNAAVAEGLPSTFVFVAAGRISSDQEKKGFVGTVGTLNRRAFGRLWVCCEGSDGECLSLQHSLSEVSIPPSHVIARIKEGSSSLFPSNGSFAIINLDGLGYICAYGAVPAIGNA